MSSSTSTGVVVAYDADVIDLAGHVGWSVIVTGLGSAGHRSSGDHLLQAAAGAVGSDHGLRHPDPELVTRFHLTGGDLATQLR